MNRYVQAPGLSTQFFSQLEQNDSFDHGNSLITKPMDVLPCTDTFF